MGPARLPRSIQSWDGLLNSPTSLGGGGRHPELDWTTGSKICRTRLTTPKEFVKAASLPDDYLAWCSGYADGDVDKYAMVCVINGVPLRTSTAIDSQVMKVLQKADKEVTNPQDMHISARFIHQTVRSMLVDTGANGNVHFKDCDDYLEDSKPSRCSITVANKGTLEVSRDGTLAMQIVTTTHGDKESDSILKVKTTTADVQIEMFSLDALYQTGQWGLHIRPSGQKDKSAELYTLDGRKIPLRYNWGDQGGFWLDYLLVSHADQEHLTLLNAAFANNTAAVSETKATRVDYYTRTEAKAMTAAIAKDDDVIEVFVGQHDADRQIRGVKSRLKSKVA